MDFSPKGSAGQGLELLAQRLDGIIAAKLAPKLNGLPWVQVLTELDRMKGNSAREYNHKDLHAQLRMLTERLGGLGHPFDDPKTRAVSVLGGELRIVRNRWAHGYDFETLDAWRTQDFIVRLLEHFRDEVGAEKAKKIRRVALEAFVEEQGIQAGSGSIEQGFIQDVDALIDGSRKEPEGIGGTGRAEDVVPDPSVFWRDFDQESSKTIGEQRAEFEPWMPVLVGESAELDSLRRKSSKEKVQSVSEEIVEFEGPVHIDRLVRMVAASFGVVRVHDKKQKAIAHQIRKSEFFVDSQKFVWPKTIDPTTWREFRPNSSSVARDFLQISPVEIANAARFIKQQSPDISQGELETETLKTFGRKRRVKRFMQHLALAFVD